MQIIQLSNGKYSVEKNGTIQVFEIWGCKYSEFTTLMLYKMAGKYYLSGQIQSKNSEWFCIDVTKDVNKLCSYSYKNYLEYTKHLKALQDIFPRCYLCSKFFSSKNKPTIDHIIPRSRGGSNEFSNLALACSSCNATKGNLLLSELPAVNNMQEYQEKTMFY